MGRNRDQARGDLELHRRVLKAQKLIDRGVTADDIDDATARRLGRDVSPD